MCPHQHATGPSESAGAKKQAPPATAANRAPENQIAEHNSACPDKPGQIRRNPRRRLPPGPRRAPKRQRADQATEPGEDPGRRTRGEKTTGEKGRNGGKISGFPRCSCRISSPAVAWMDGCMHRVRTLAVSVLVLDRRDELLPSSASLSPSLCRLNPRLSSRSFLLYTTVRPSTPTLPSPPPPPVLRSPDPPTRPAGSPSPPRPNRSPAFASNVQFSRCK